jgi:inorganic pyrophosphatase
MKKVIIGIDIIDRERLKNVSDIITQEEVDKILRFVNQTEYQKTIIVRRGNDVPSWSNPDL